MNSRIPKSIVISILALSVGMVATIEPANADDSAYFGAIAVSQSNDEVAGEATDYDSDAGARSAALAECNKDGTTDCRIEVHFSKNKCGAVAASGSEIGFGLGATKSEAVQEAVSNIKGGKLIMAACN